VPYVGWIKIAVTSYVLPNLLWVVIIVVIVAAAGYGVNRYLKRSDKI
jgi:4-hydroxybenzoate polyprenyltransferase